MQMKHKWSINELLIYHLSFIITDMVIYCLLCEMEEPYTSALVQNLQAVDGRLISLNLFP